MTVTTESPAGVSPRRRIDVLDGIRGIAIVLVVLSHGWTIWPSTELNKVPPLRVLFGSGNFAVSIFFVVGAFLATSSMLREVERTGSLRFGVFWVRRWIRISAHVYPLVIAVLALTATDRGMNVYPLADTRASAWHIVTYTWTDYVANNAFYARPDLGHLWYVCTDIWVILLLAVLVYIFGRNRGLLFAILFAITVLVMIWRQHVYAVDGEFIALIRITTRMDPMLWGAMAAIAVPWAKRYAHRAPLYSGIALVSLVPLMFLNNPTWAYFGYAGVLLDVALFAFVLSTALADPGPRVRKLLGWRPLRFLGRYSLPIYLWHYPIFWYLSRNTFDWNWQTRLVVGLLVTFAIALVTMRVIERPLQRWLGSPVWREAVRDGLPRTLASRTRTSVRNIWSGEASEQPTAPVEKQATPVEAEAATEPAPEQADASSPAASTSD